MNEDDLVPGTFWRARRELKFVRVLGRTKLFKFDFVRYQETAGKEKVLVMPAPVFLEKHRREDG